jgi:hypothetical protein
MAQVNTGFEGKYIFLKIINLLIIHARKDDVKGSLNPTNQTIPGYATIGFENAASS